MNGAANMKVCGILGGIAWVSTMEYYKAMNELVIKYVIVQRVVEVGDVVLCELIWSPCCCFVVFI